MRIITISREFGSGGRELGKRLADALGYDYYDREIITRIAEKHDLNEDYVENILESGVWHSYPITVGHTFTRVHSVSEVSSHLLKEKQRVIEEIAHMGRDCIIVGRNADILLEEYHPFKVFVCADMDAKVKRCVERAEKNENLNSKQMKRGIRRIDKNRARTHALLGSTRWGARDAYHLIVNTTSWSIKELTPVVAAYAKAWFERETQ